jgi:hypothetical protein
MRIVLKVTVDYIDGTIDHDEAVDQLLGAANYCANNGLLSGDGLAEIEHWEAEAN